jgi:alkylhydroperoxidase family enzyme
MIVTMNLDILTAETAPPDSRPLLDGMAADIGFVPNLAAVAAASPTLLAAFDALRRAVSVPTFTPVHREIAGVAVGVAVDNSYGVAFHSTVLGSLGVDEADIDAMRAGAEPADPVHAAVYAFARHVALDRGRSSEQVVQRAHGVGLTDADLLPLVAECTFASLVGVIDNLVGRVPLDEFLQSQAWKAG